MPNYVLEYTPVTSRSGRVIHAVSLAFKPTETVCGKRFRHGWKISLGILDCVDCRVAVGEVRKAKRRKKRRK